VTLMAPPADRATLVKFYQTVRPAGPGWAVVRGEAGVTSSPDSLPQAMLGWVLGCAFVYAALFGVGSYLYGHITQAVVCLAVCVVSGFGVLRVLQGFWTEGAPAN
jgi:SSS family solute:Na+ symporter